MGLPGLTRVPYRLRTFSRILWTAFPVFSVAFVTVGLTTATVLSATSLAVRRVASAAGVTATTTSFVLTPIILVAALVVALLPPAASMIRTLRQSEHRNEILSQLAKYQEHLRETAEAVPTLPANEGS